MLGNFRDARDSYTSMMPSKVAKDKINPFKGRDGSTGNQSSLPNQRHIQEDRSTIFQTAKPIISSQKQQKFQANDSLHSINAH